MTADDAGEAVGHARRWRDIAGLTEQVGEIVGRHLPPGLPGPVGPDDKLADLEIGSLGLVGLIADLEAAFCVRFPERMLVRETFSTIRVIVGHIAEIARARPGLRDHAPHRDHGTPGSNIAAQTP